VAVIVFRRAARRDLARIAAHIAAADPRAAVRLQLRIVRRIELLRIAPQSAQPRPELGTDIRTLPIGRYVVILRVQTADVVVLRILHSAQDLTRLLKPNL
jgi:plasmid stabilization system protein ParE